MHLSFASLHSFNFSMTSPFDTAVTSTATSHLLFAHATNSMAHWKVFKGFPWAPIKQMAMLGKHCVAQPASPFARHSPNLAKHLAFSTAPIADATHSCSSASHFLMMSMTPLSTSPTAAFWTAKEKGWYSSSMRRSFFVHSFLAQLTNCIPQAIMAFQFPRAPIMHQALWGRQGPAQAARSFPIHMPYPM